MLIFRLLHPSTLSTRFGQHISLLLDSEASEERLKVTQPGLQSHQLADEGPTAWAARLIGEQPEDAVKITW